MKNVIYVTGNEHKAKYFSKLVGTEVEHAPVDVAEMQSLDPIEILTEKAKYAFKELGRPILIEDTSLSIQALGRLPGPFIKWFIMEIGLERICRLADADPKRAAVASCVFAYYDGKILKIFTGESSGIIAREPRGDMGFGWTSIFIPDGAKDTMGEMDEAGFAEAYLKFKPIKAVGEFINTLPETDA